MTFQVSDFAGQVRLTAAIHNAYPNMAAELTAIATALGSDPSTHDTTITTPPVGLQPGNPANSHFTNDILLVINAGKGGNLTNAQMAAAITAGIPVDVPPSNTVAPAVTGTPSIGNNLTTTNGTWTESPTSFTYQWLRASVPISGAVNQVYALVGADSGNPVRCQVTAINAAGSASANSNTVAVA